MKVQTAGVNPRQHKIITPQKKSVSNEGQKHLTPKHLALDNIQDVKISPRDLRGTQIPKNSLISQLIKNKERAKTQM